MTTITHRSTAYLRPSSERYARACQWPKSEPISTQFRFVVRMAVACHNQGVPYEMDWTIKDSVMHATVSVSGKVPTPKPLPKEPKMRLVPSWKPAIWDAEYRLDAYHDANLKRMRPGFVIEHSCGLSLVHPCESGELGITEHGADEDIRQNWCVTHTASGQGFGLTLNFNRAANALLLAASFPVDWTKPVGALGKDPQFKRAGNSVKATFGNGYDRQCAKEKLAELERAA